MFRERSTQKELIDLGPAFYSYKEYKQCMTQLFQINVLLGFFHGTVRFLKKIPHVQTVVDLGCGNGLFILKLSHYYPTVKFIGLDINSSAIEQANELLCAANRTNRAPNISFQHQEADNMNIPTADVIITTLVCHHLEDHELIDFLQNAFKAANRCVVINDLHRHYWAYGLYALLSPLFGNRLIIHDGLLSIRRGFTKQDWNRILQQCNILKYEIRWCFPFRWRVVLWKE